VGARFASHNRVFVSSSTVSLSALADVANADLECARLAADAGDSGNYLAWISTGTASALSRIGSVEPIPSGWVRADGAPFAASLVDLVHGRVLFPPVLTEVGDEVSPAEPIATATFDHGNEALDCFGWSSPESVYQRGHAHAGSHGWTALDQGTCLDAEARLYCFGVDSFGPIEVSPRSGDRIAFVSSSTWDPSTGLSSADALCQSEAALAALPGTYLAFMAGASSSATIRVDLDSAPWSRTDGIPLVDAAIDLPVGLLSALTVESDGRTHAGDALVWTGIDADATMPGSLGSSCMDWTTSSSTSFGTVGAPSLTTTAWTHNLSPARCDERHRVYCFQRQ
jgi:hypothetical protein